MGIYPYLCKAIVESIPKQPENFYLRQIHYFDLLEEREYWRKIMTGIKQNWENGIIRVHELGRGMKLLFPSVAFFLCR